MKVLIVSRTPWDESNSFGNTFSNLFGGMENTEIFHICCQSGATNNRIVSKSFQMTEASVLKSIVGKPAGAVVGNIQQDTNGKKRSFQNKVKRWPIFYIARDVIWKAGRWKNAPEFLRYLQSIEPDVIYLPLYASWYMCDIQQYIIGYYKDVPYVGHVSDDIYSLPKGFLTPPLFVYYRRKLQKKLRRLITESQYLEVFAENMKTEYSSIFRKKCYLIGKGVNTKELAFCKDRANKENEKRTFVYTGNIGGGRFRVLLEAARAIDRVYDEGEACLLIYTATHLTNGMSREARSVRCLKVMGEVSASEVKKIQQSADYLIHAEDLSKKAAFETKMSFSTKIIDYLVSGRPIIAIGPAEINSMQILEKEHMAITVNKPDQVEDTIRRIRTNEIDMEELRRNSMRYLIQQRDIWEIQKGMHDRLAGLVKAEDNGIQQETV